LNCSKLCLDFSKKTRVINQLSKLIRRKATHKLWYITYENKFVFWYQNCQSYLSQGYPKPRVLYIEGIKANLFKMYFWGNHISRMISNYMKKSVTIKGLKTIITPCHYHFTSLQFLLINSRLVFSCENSESFKLNIWKVFSFFVDVLS